MSCMVALNANLKDLQFHRMSVVARIDIWGRLPHRQIGMDKVVILGSLGGVIFSTPAQNTRDLGSIPALGAIFPIS